MSSIGRAPPPSPEPVEPAPVRLTRAEAEEAGALLEAEARDGRITRSEIRKAEAQIARKYGPEKARAILVSALGQDPAKVDFEAVSYLQGRVGSMNGHGERDFDRVCKDLKIGPWVQENDAAAAWKIRGEGRSGKVASSPDVVKKDLKPGDYTYFKNWSVSLAGYNAGWQGENVISLGKGKYYGHPFGITTGEETVAYLNAHRRTTGTVKSASLLDLRASVDPRILKLDKNPG